MVDGSPFRRSDDYSYPYGVMVINYTMRPFYSLLKWMDAYVPGAPSDPVPSDTDVIEFRRLASTVQKAVDRFERQYDDRKMFIGNVSHELQTPLAACINRIEMMPVGNLVRNAFRYAPSGSEILIDFTDNGFSISNAGSSPLDEEKVFRKFYQPSGRKEGSTGLGLALVHTICVNNRLEVSYTFDKNCHIFRVNSVSFQNCV